MKKKARADQILVERGLFESREGAQRAIMAAEVRVGERLIEKPAEKIDIEAAKQALTKSENQEVRAFADDMVRDHTAVNKQALALYVDCHVVEVPLNIRQWDALDLFQRRARLTPCYRNQDHTQSPENCCVPFHLSLLD